MQLVPWKTLDEAMVRGGELELIWAASRNYQAPFLSWKRDLGKEADLAPQAESPDSLPEKNE